MNRIFKGQSVQKLKFLRSAAGAFTRTLAASEMI